MKGSKYQGEMGKYKVSVLLFLVFFALCTLLVLKVEARAYSSSLEREIEAKLKLSNKPAVKSIKSEDGDIIDCIDIYKQPAFDHPALKNHTIQRIPSFLLESQSSSIRSTTNASIEVYQTWKKSGSCPQGTVPIRRIKKDDLLRAISLDRFGKKPLEPNTTNTTDDVASSMINRSDAHLATIGENFIGATANINIWNPKVDRPEDFTTAQIWLKAANRLEVETIEAGWQVNPKLYGDDSTRLFIYWTKDSYKSTGCFDLTCPGFVQVSKEVAIGSHLGPYSHPFDQQYEINIGLFQDDDGNWWLRVKGNHIVGYWPKEMLGNLGHSATLVQWGGQVFSYKVKSTPPHTGTQMGSGEEASDKFGFACYMTDVRIKDYSKSLKYPAYVTTFAAEPYCYSALNDVHYGQYPVFYFGGSGRNRYCK
ncbi:uncharacterized protein LOC123895757 [Trifolium pratense]|uniref:uncharacterized protein LOC123895757 n=1 Tax=Trifolium pratense TaxID=57577 RepID=UPI001E696813|nr:uncharacterized protein LOC123895757 [Trifolium pratense]